MFKVLLPTTDYPPARGGVARYIGAIQKTYPEQVYVLRLRKFGRVWSLVIRLFFSVQGYDALWTHHVLPVATAAMIVGRLTHKPYVVFVHGKDFDLARRNAWKRWLTKQVLRSADRIVTNSEALAAEVRSFVALDKLPMVVYPPLEDQFIEAARHKTSTREKVNLQKLGELALGVAHSATPMFVSSAAVKNDSVLRLLTVSRLVGRKGHLQVLQALLKIPGATYHIVGDGPIRSGLEKMVRSLGLEERVDFSPDVTDEQLPGVYANADIFVMPTVKTPTDREGFGIVYLEAQLFGLPVIASKHPGVDEAIRDGDTGILVPPSDQPDALIAAIEYLRDPAVRRKFGARGKSWVEHEFTRERQMLKLKELL